jgi:uncharacterized protein (TIGR01777 family)
MGPEFSLKRHERMKNMKRIILAGGSGFLGTVLADAFSRSGWEVVVLTRSPGKVAGAVRDVYWDGSTLGSWAEELEGATAVFNLSGKSVDCRYSPRNRREIMDSRVDSTRVIGEALSRCATPPSVWLNASTATIYKHTFGKPHDESGEIKATPEAKDGFSIEVGIAWEKTFREAVTPGVRKVALRMTMVLGHGSNSVFPVLRRLVRFGLGGTMGSGKQNVSWIHVDDYCAAIEWIINHPELSGRVNVAAPNPVTNREMMACLRKVCGVPIGLPATNWMLEVGAFLLRTETELIIKSRRVSPRKLLESGFKFRFPEIERAFEDLNTNAVGGGKVSFATRPSA